jgi:bacillithiol biosynthesis deacetylase BshB1
MEGLFGKTEIDVLAFGAHPDDVEFGCGGSMILFRDAGFSLVVIDITRGEKGSLGTPETRQNEANKASEILRVSARETWGFPDTELESTLPLKKRIVSAIRKYRPALVLAPWIDDLHPDHSAAGRAVREAYYPSGMKNFDAPGQPFRPVHLLHYFLHTQGTANFAFDVTSVWKRRMSLARSFSSQLCPPSLADEFQTYTSSPAFAPAIEARARIWGRKCGFELAEPFQSTTGLLGISNVNALFGEC